MPVGVRFSVTDVNHDCNAREIVTRSGEKGENKEKQSRHIFSPVTLPGIFRCIAKTVGCPYCGTTNRFDIFEIRRLSFLSLENELIHGN